MDWIYSSIRADELPAPAFVLPASGLGLGDWAWLRRKRALGTLAGDCTISCRCGVPRARSEYGSGGRIAGGA